MKPIKIALAGNPNCGKTAVFNLLTGSKQRVGNWPGVTVERKSGFYEHDKHAVEVVDLPGTYSLSVSDEATSIDERIACDFLVSESVDCIVNVIDGSNLERNLYLTMQLMDMQIPMILVVNMMDLVMQRGLSLDLKQLAKTMGCAVVPMVASRGQGVKQLREAVARVAENPEVSDWELPLGDALQQAVLCVKQSILQQGSMQHIRRLNWLALGLLANDRLAKLRAGELLVRFSEPQLARIVGDLQEDVDILIADARYGFIGQLVDSITALHKTPRQTITQTLDKVVLSRMWGIPIFLFVMYCMFLFAINIGGAFQDFFDIGSTTIFIDGVAHWMVAANLPPWLVAIVANGVGKGINTVITFTPIIAGMFLFLSFLEDSGYMARAAFVVDRCMRALGLPGKSFVPMIVGFGCNVPAVMGARTLANPRDRILTVLMMPFMSCGARLAIFSVFASAFFPHGGQNVIFILYLTGILVAVFTGWVLRKTLLQGKPAPMVMELPPYHVPQVKGLCVHTWSRLKRFLLRAGRVIVPVCMLIGALNAVSIHGTLIKQSGGASGQQSLLSAIGKTVTPILKPMGVHDDNWPATVGLVMGVLAKEVVVGTLNTLYSQAADLTQQEAASFNLKKGLLAAVDSVGENLSSLGQAFTNPLKANEAAVDVNNGVYGVMVQFFESKAAAFAYLLFVLLYFPCVATMAATQRELGRRWAVFSVLWSTSLAYSIAVMVYQALTIAAHPIASVAWIGGLGVLLAGIVCVMRYMGQIQLAGSQNDFA